MLLAFPVVCLISFHFSVHIRNLFFACCYSLHLPIINAAFDPHRLKLFSSLKSITSANPELRRLGLIRIVEIGAGPGANLKYYPENSRVICVDPNPYFKTYFLRNQKEFPNVKVEQCILGVGEDLNTIPDDSIDVVVATFLLCSVSDVEQVLREIKRVLVPGGNYYFLEHVLAPPGTWRNIIQRAINPIWSYVMAGCNLSRDNRRAIQSAGFAAVSITSLDVNSPIIYLKLLIRPQIMGTATKGL